ncbi:Ig-like domain-containing protein [Pseudidiomarina salilacus]|uniref:Ig-like domain-containing protein n=1 Tax=Pseudidiomarina salilacus TaxID=3384452 RepID=UPI0039849B1A
MLFPRYSFALFIACTLSACGGGSDSTPQPPAPVAYSAQNDSAEVELGESVDIDVLANDSGDNSTDFAIVSVSEPSTGSVTISNNKISYTPGEDFLGEVTFDYTGTNGANESSASITVSVAATVTVAGRVAIPQMGGGEVVATVNDSDYQTTIAGDGSYSLSLRITDANDTRNIILRAKGAADASFITLSSELPATAELLEQASTDRTLTADENAKVVLTPFTTAATVQLLNATADASLDASNLTALYRLIDAELLAEMAAVTHYLSNGSAEQLPNGLTTIEELLFDAQQLNAFSAELAENGELVMALNQLAENEANTASIDPAEFRGDLIRFSNFSEFKQEQLALGLRVAETDVVTFQNNPEQGFDFDGKRWARDLVYENRSQLTAGQFIMLYGDYFDPDAIDQLQQAFSNGEVNALVELYSTQENMRLTPVLANGGMLTLHITSSIYLEPSPIETDSGVITLNKSIYRNNSTFATYGHEPRLRSGTSFALDTSQTRIMYGLFDYYNATEFAGTSDAYSAHLRTEFTPTNETSGTLFRPQTGDEGSYELSQDGTKLSITWAADNLYVSHEDWYMFTNEAGYEHAIAHRYLKDGNHYSAIVPFIRKVPDLSFVDYINGTSALQVQSLEETIFTTTGELRDLNEMYGVTGLIWRDDGALDRIGVICAYQSGSSNGCSAEYEVRNYSWWRPEGENVYSNFRCIAESCGGLLYELLGMRQAPEIAISYYTANYPAGLGPLGDLITPGEVHFAGAYLRYFHAVEIDTQSAESAAALAMPKAISKHQQPLMLEYPAEPAHPSAELQP